MAFQLERLQSDLAIVTERLFPTAWLQQWWQTMAETIEAQERRQDDLLVIIQAEQVRLDGVVSDLALVVDELGQQLVLIQAAQAAADEAQTSANAAQSSANAVTAVNSISASYTVPSMVLTATDAGTDATITVADFVRQYDDGTQVSVTGGALTGQPYSTLLSVYYDDTTRANTTPTLIVTANRAGARHNVVPGRHFLANITTPAAGAPATSGGSTPPGGGDVPPATLEP